MQDTRRDETRRSGACSNQQTHEFPANQRVCATRVPCRLAEGNRDPAAAGHGLSQSRSFRKSDAMSRFPVLGTDQVGAKFLARVEFCRAGTARMDAGGKRKPRFCSAKKSGRFFRRPVAASVTRPTFGLRQGQRFSRYKKYILPLASPSRGPLDDEIHDL